MWLVSLFPVLVFGSIASGSVVAALEGDFQDGGDKTAAALVVMNICITLAVILTYPLQFLPAIQVLDGLIWSTEGSKGSKGSKGSRVPESAPPPLQAPPPQAPAGGLAKGVPADIEAGGGVTLYGAVEGCTVARCQRFRDRHQKLLKTLLRVGVVRANECTKSFPHAELCIVPAWCVHGKCSVLLLLMHLKYQLVS